MPSKQNGPSSTVALPLWTNCGRPWPSSPQSCFTAMQNSALVASALPRVVQRGTVAFVRQHCRFLVVAAALPSL